MPAIHIGILNFNLFDDHSAFYSEYLLSDTKTHKIFTDNYSLRVLQLNQLENATEEERSSELYQWARFSRLTAHLIEDNRLEDLKRATEDKELLARLYEEYGLST